MTLTKQQVFDRVWQHFIVKNEPRGQDEDNVCLYRTDSGARCAIGLFMTDEEAGSAPVGHTSTEIMGEGLCAALTGVDVTFLLRLQEAHDFPKDHSGMNDSLLALADKHSLEVPS